MSTILKPTAEDTRLYELAILVSASLSEKEYAGIQKGVEETLKEHSATVAHKDEWGRMGLAYKIKGNTEGRFVIYYIEAKPEVVREIDGAVRLEKGVLRHILISLPENYEVVDFTKRFAEWQKEKDKEEVRAEKIAEEELKKKIVRKVAKKPTATKEAPAKSVGPAEEIDLEEKLGEIISDEDLNL